MFLRLGFPILLTVVLAWGAPPVARAQAPDLYEAAVPVRGQDAESRAAVLPVALARVLVKLSGDVSAAARPGVNERLQAASGLVQHYRYQQSSTVIDGVPQLREQLVVRFDPAQVDALAAEVGLAVWPAPRAPALLWLWIDDGRGLRGVGASQAAAVDALLARAGERGLGLVLPLQDAEDQSAGADGGALAAQRYAASRVLSGRMARAGDGWRADWTLTDQDTVLARWSETFPAAEQLFAAAADRLADTLARHDLDAVSTGTPGRYRIAVAGLAGPGDYPRLIAGLQRLAVVRALQPVSAQGDVLVLDLDLSAGVDALARLGAGLLEAQPDAGDGTARFRLRGE